MIHENLKMNDAKVQSLGMKFSFQTQPDKLIINANCSENKTFYVGDIAVNPYTDFELIKELLELNQYKTLTKTEDLLKIRIGTTIVELISISQSEIKKLQKMLEKSLEKQSQLQKTIQSQKTRIYDHELMISDLRKTVEEILLNPKVPMNELQEMKTEVNDKINLMAESVKSEISSIQSRLTFHTQKFSEQQKQFEQIWNEIKTLKSYMDEDKVQMLSDKMENNKFKEFVSRQLNDLKNIDNGHSAMINELKKEVDHQLKCIKLILESYDIKLGQLSNIKINYSIEEKKQLNQQQKEKQQKERLAIILAKIEEEKRSYKLSQQLVKFYRWNDQLKNNKLEINGSTVTFEQSSSMEIVRLQAGFTKELKHKQYWGIKIKRLERFYYILLGVNLKTKVQNSFQKQYDGLQVINNRLQCSSRFKKKPKNVNDLDIKQGDVIFMQYDPIEWKMRFKINKKGMIFEIPITPLVQNQVYHPYVGFQLIQCEDSFRFYYFDFQLIYPCNPFKQQN